MTDSSTRNSRRRRRPHKAVQGNVGAETTTRGFGDIVVWVRTADDFKHNLYLTVDEAEVLVGLLDSVLDAVSADEVV